MGNKGEKENFLKDQGTMLPPSLPPFSRPLPTQGCPHILPSYPGTRFLLILGGRGIQRRAEGVKLN